MSQLGDIKNKIRDKLQELVDTDPAKLKTVIVLNPMDAAQNLNIPLYPAAILSTPSTKASTRMTNVENERVHTFDIVVLVKKENISKESPGTYFEDLIEAILNKFDDNEYLGGLALAIEPSTSQPEPVASADKALIAFVVALDVRLVRLKT